MPCVVNRMQAPRGICFRTKASSVRLALALWVLLVAPTLAQSTAKISAVPVSASGAYTTDGNAIVVQAGARVWIEVRVRDWDTDHNDSPLLRSIQVKLSPSGLVTNAPCALGAPCPAAQSCGVTADCTSEFGLHAGCETQAARPPYLPPGGSWCGPLFIDLDRSDFLFSSVQIIASAQPYNLLRAWALAENRDDSAPDDGTSKYLATLVLDVPANASGSYIVAFDPLETYIIDNGIPGGSIPIASVENALITIEGGPCVQPSCDYATGFESGEGFLPGSIGNGTQPAGCGGTTSACWGRTAAADASLTQGHISTLHPESGQQHLRLSHDPTTRTNQPNWGLGVDARFPQNADVSVHSAVPSVISADIAISNPFGADFIVQSQSLGEGLVTARILFFYTGSIYVLDDAGSGANYFSTGHSWDTSGEYRPLRIESDPCANTLRYFYDGALIYDGVGGLFAGTIVDQLIFWSDNFPGSFLDIDNVVIARDPNNCASCGDGVVQGPSETCEPGNNPTGCGPGHTCGAIGTAEQCTCARICTLGDPCVLHAGTNGPFTPPFDAVYGGIFRYQAASEAVAVELCGSTGIDTNIFYWGSCTDPADPGAANDDCCDPSNASCGTFGDGSDPSASCYNNVGAPNYESCTCHDNPTPGDNCHLLQTNGGGSTAATFMIEITEKAACDQCAPDHYNYPTCAFCQAATTCSSHGTCNALGDCECDMGFVGVACELCAPGYANYPTCALIPAPPEVGNDVCIGGPNAGLPCGQHSACPGGLCLLKNRFISATIPVTTTSHGLKVTPSSLDANSISSPANYIGTRRWAGIPSLNVNDGVSPPFHAAQVQCFFTLQDWSTVGEIHLYGDVVVPQSSYDLSMCSSVIGPCSTTLQIDTAKFGDVVPPLVAGQPSFQDIVSLVDKFQGRQAGPSKTRAKLREPVDPEAPVGFLEVSTEVSAFQGKTYQQVATSPPATCGESCCAVHSSPGCSDSVCELEVCGFDPYCCGQDPEHVGSWDSLCVSEAIAFCSVCQFQAATDR